MALVSVTLYRFVKEPFTGRLRNNLLMKNERKPPRALLAENLRALMNRDGLSGAEVGRRAGVAAKTVTNMLNEEHDAELDKVAAVAGVFGLSLWQLIRPGLKADLGLNGRVDKLIDNYLQSSESGRESILQVSELAAKYKTS